jgi:adhesin transport system membrane fusion protein
MSVTGFDDAFGDHVEKPSRTIWLIAAIGLVFVLWAAFAWVDEIVRAEGSVVSSSKPQIIQNLEGGILAELTVSEGDVVETGQHLGRLYGTQYQAIVDELSDQIAALEIRRLRLEAEMRSDTSFDVPADLEARVPEIASSERRLLAARLSDYDATLEGAEAVQAQTSKELELLQRMYDQEIAPLIEVTRARKSHSDAQNTVNAVITQTELERASEYSKVQNELGSMRQKLKLSQDQLARTVFLAPMRGVVNKLSVTTIGGVVRPGEEIMQIIPLDEELFIQAKVKPRDIASVRQGQNATIKLSAYDYTVWGSMKAQVVLVSADSFKDERAKNPEAEAYYRVTLAVDRSLLTEGQKDLEIRPGMQATVELETGGKTVLTYLLKPLYKANEALRER